jgi:uncharacterized membrane protein
MQFLSPMLLPKGSVNDFSGRVGIVNNKEQIDQLPIPINYLYLSGDYLCHQKSERSFFLNENQMPFCARCTAIFIGIVIGLAIMVFFSIVLDERFIFLIIISLIPVGIDGIGQLIGLWESTNLIRVITGLFVGIMSGIAIGIISEEIQNLYKSKNS